MIKKLDTLEPMLRFYSQARQKINNYKYWKETGAAVVAVLMWIFGIYSLFFSAPFKFPDGVIVRINKNATISEVGTSLESNHMIRSELIFKILTRLSSTEKIIAGDYRFKEGVNIFTMIRRVTRGEFGIDPVRITVLEGLNSREIATILDKKLPVFDKDKFLQLADPKEGFLFPDTYFIKPSDDEQDIINMMVDNFDKQVGVIKLEILSSNRDFNDILTMASIIELETRTAESRRMVSGILWNRINKDMKLQVDAVFPYIMNKYSLQLTVKDLQFDSPYNTYRYKGLPPGPVGNPGLDSIKAALNPTKTSYLYYLSDRKGKMYYAETYKSHMVNRSRYLGS